MRTVIRLGEVAQGVARALSDGRQLRRDEKKRATSPKIIAASITNSTATAAIVGVYPYRSALKILIGSVSMVKPTVT